jgi:hypothetical protein
MSFGPPVGTLGVRHTSKEGGSTAAASARYKMLKHSEPGSPFVPLVSESYGRLCAEAYEFLYERAAVASRSGEVESAAMHRYTRVQLSIALAKGIENMFVVVLVLWPGSRGVISASGRRFRLLSEPFAERLCTVPGRMCARFWLCCRVWWLLCRCGRLLRCGLVACFASVALVLSHNRSLRVTSLLAPCQLHKASAPIYVVKVTQSKPRVPLAAWRLPCCFLVAFIVPIYVVKVTQLQRAWTAETARAQTEEQPKPWLKQRV